jgi:hypothetical protein
VALDCALFDEPEAVAALLDALSAGSWPLARIPKITAQTARKSVTVRTTTVWRIRRLRRRRCATRGCTVAADMAGRLRALLKASLSGA